MAVTLVQGDPVKTASFSGTTTPALAYASAVASGNTLVGAYSADTGSTVTSVADSVNGGNWTQSVAQTGTNNNVYQYRKENTAAGTPTVTFTVNNSNNGCQITLYEIHGSVATPTLDVTNKSTGTTGVSNPGNLNTTQANSILIADTENGAGESTAGTSYTFLNSANGFQFAGAQYRIVTSTSNYSTAFGTDTGGTWAAVAAAYGETVAAAGAGVGQILGNWYHPGANIVNMARFQPSLQQFGKIGSLFRKTLNQLGTRVGSKRSHDTD